MRSFWSDHMNHKNKLFAGYVPVIHQGYIDAFERHPNTPVGVFDETITSEFDYLRKDIRALEPRVAVFAIRGLGISAFTLGRTELDSYFAQKSTLIMPDDDISRTLTNACPERLAEIQFESTFLRWDRQNSEVNSDVKVDRTISTDELSISHDIVSGLLRESELSTDWWRHVAAGVLVNGQLVMAHNRAMPHEHTHFIEGDPRITEKRGQNISKSLFIHAEADLIAHMAKEGIRTEDKDLFVTTFPCPNCARLIAACGFRACYFIEGYAMADGQRILNEANIEIVKIETDIVSSPNLLRLREYPEKN